MTTLLGVCCFDGECYRSRDSVQIMVGNTLPTNSIFGCKAMVQVPAEKQKSKLDKRSIPCIFVGYPNDSKGNKLFNPETGKMIRSNDVFFFEKEFPLVTGNPKKQDIIVNVNFTLNQMTMKLQTLFLKLYQKSFRIRY